MFANGNVGSQFTTRILRAAYAMSAMIGDAASNAHRATYGSESWSHRDRSVRYTRHLNCQVGDVGENATQALHTAWRSVWSQPQR